MLPEIPSRAIVAPSGLDVVVRCGLSNVALKVIAPARSAVSRMTITWSGALANTSRVWRTPFSTYVVVAVAVVRSSLRWYCVAPDALPKARRRLPTNWYASCPPGVPIMVWLIRSCACVHWSAKTRRRISASAAAPRVLLES
jgi:hypothetical protein